MILLITGLMASGKSTVAELLASHFPRAVHLRGDLFRRMIVSGREDMGPEAGAEALRQLELRYRLSAQAALGYQAAGFTVVLQDNYYGQALPQMAARLGIPHSRVFVLDPGPDVIARRERERGKRGYGSFDVAALYRDFHASTPRIGRWIDSGGQSPEETVRAILDCLGDGEGD